MVNKESVKSSNILDPAFGPTATGSLGSNTPMQTQALPAALLSLPTTN